MTKQQIAEKLIATYRDKNKDYGNSAHRTYVEFGEVALVIRISDKLSRLTNLVETGESRVSDESMLDTIGDAVTYLCMLVAEIDCEHPDWFQEEQFACTENIWRTIELLDGLPSVDCTVHSFVAAYREDLLRIYRSTGDSRRESYLMLAARLLTEYEYCSERSDAK